MTQPQLSSSGSKPKIPVLMESKCSPSKTNTGNRPSRRYSKPNFIDNTVNSMNPKPLQLPRKQKSRPLLNDSDLNYTPPAKRGQKVSLNHLLNFTIPERQTVQWSKRTSHQPAFNKERFVNAK